MSKAVRTLAALKDPDLLKKGMSVVNTAIAKAVVSSSDSSTLKFRTDTAMQVTGIKLVDGGYRVFSIPVGTYCSLVTTYVGKKAGLIARFRLSEKSDIDTFKCNEFEVPFSKFEALFGVEGMASFEAIAGKEIEIMAILANKPADGPLTPAVSMSSSINPAWGTF